MDGKNVNLKQHLKLEILDKISGDLVCGCGCGYIIQEKTPTLEYQEGFDIESINHNFRTGLPSSKFLHDGGLSTIISPFNTDYLHSKLPIENYMIYNRLRVIDSWCRILTGDKSKRRMSLGLECISRICNVMALDHKVQENTSVFYRKMVSDDWTRARKYLPFCAACCYLICKEMGKSVSTNDFIVKLNLNQSIFMKYIHLIISENKQVIVSLPNNYLTNIANQLQLKQNILLLADQIMKIAVETGLTGGKNPKGVAASCILLAHDKIEGSYHKREIFLVSDLVDAAQVTDVTIREFKKEMIQDPRILEVLK